MSTHAQTTPGSPVTTASKRLLVVDDHPVFRHGICQFLDQFSDVAVCGEAANAQLALEAMRQLKPEVVLLDVSMPGTNGIELIKHMLAEQPSLIILIISMHDESLYALRALRAGAKGYVMKQQAMENILEALRKIIGGGIYVSPQFSEKLIFKTIQGSDGDMGSPVDKLSDRELEVLQLFGRDKKTREIANALHLSVKTVETHRMHIKEKLGFKDADEMMKFAIEWVTVTQD
ncbi:response regulator transcription factor [Prosthecobacter sp.]|uniref:response regulator transcription factor n=1 Tax=Prosthecobacter sp. TaxID=1965333 RepID=UPI002ABC9752|nr:response regulator transcription factor [Prosthecobacter sp.]MDZ4403970.1 response regulator transcription factor [Prosthecobacter sp.]